MELRRGCDEATREFTLMDACPALDVWRQTSVEIRNQTLVTRPGTGTAVGRSSGRADKTADLRIAEWLR